MVTSAPCEYRVRETLRPMPLVPASRVRGSALAGSARRGRGERAGGRTAGDDVLAADELRHVLLGEREREDLADDGGHDCWCVVRGRKQSARGEEALQRERAKWGEHRQRRAYVTSARARKSTRPAPPTAPVRICGRASKAASPALDETALADEQTIVIDSVRAHRQSPRSTLDKGEAAAETQNKDALLLLARPLRPSPAPAPPHPRPPPPRASPAPRASPSQPARAPRRPTPCRRA